MPARSTNHEREIGALQATVSMLAETMKDQAVQHDKIIRQQGEQHATVLREFKDALVETRHEIAALRGQVNAMTALIDQAKGGWKVIVGVGTISAAVGAIITKLFTLGGVFPVKLP
jgi:hypothetical protein